VGLLIFTIIFILGQGVFAISFQWHTYAIAFVGRIIYAIGDSNLSVAANSFLSKYFSGKEIAFALGVKSCLPRLGGIVINTLQPIFYAYFQNLQSVFYITFGIASIAIIIVGLLIYFCKEDTIQEEATHLKDITNFPLVFWLLVICCGFQYVCIFCFNNISSKMIQKRFNASLIQSSEYIVMPLSVNIATHCGNYKPNIWICNR
jgi:MFS family permease